MAFFGLTALGPQSPFRSGYKHAFNCSLFSSKEFSDAFQKLAASSASAAPSSLPLDEVMKVFTAVFHGPAPGPEAERINSCFTLEAFPAGSVTLSEFMSVVEELRTTADSAVQLDQTKAARFNSLDMMASQRTKGTRPEHGPKDVYQEPMTLLQEIGWRGEEQPLGYVKKPKNHCAETKFYAEFLKSGYL